MRPFCGLAARRAARLDSRLHWEGAKRLTARASRCREIQTDHRPKSSITRINPNCSEPNIRRFVALSEDRQQRSRPPSFRSIAANRTSILSRFWTDRGKRRPEKVPCKGTIVCIRAKNQSSSETSRRRSDDNCAPCWKSPILFPRISRNS